MGEIVENVDLVNTRDQDNADNGLISSVAVRRARIQAVVDTGAVSMAIPEDVVSDLGLPIIEYASTQMADGSTVTLAIAGSLGLQIQGRAMDTDCLVVPPDAEALVGVVAMERMDLIPDPWTQTLSPRPESPNLPLLRA